MAEVTVRKQHPTTRRLKDQLWEWARRTNFGYRLWIWRRFGLSAKPTGRPAAGAGSAVLRSNAEVETAVRETERCGLPKYGTASKYWDGLLAVGHLLNSTSPEDAVLDAGAETYSPILPWLARYGYTRLRGCNLLFTTTTRVGPIRYEPGDITHTRYPDGFFGAVSCMSVIEHGVDTSAFLREMRRIIRPGGVLVLSTDYWKDAIDIGDRAFFGMAWQIFSPQGIEALVRQAGEVGLELLQPLDLECEEPVVEFDGLRYTFIFLAFKVPAR